MNTNASSQNVEQFNANDLNKPFKLLHVRASFKENTPSNYKYYDSIKEMIPDVMDKETSTFEILDKPIRRIYLDLENIPDEKTNLVYDLINDFKKLLKIDDNINGCKNSLHSFIQLNNCFIKLSICSIHSTISSK